MFERFARGRWFVVRTAGRPSPTVPAVMPALAVLSALAIGLAAESASAADAPPAAAARPNILFAIADDWGHNHTSFAQAKFVRTPHFDRVAQEGIRFEHCFTSNPKCSPCRASILTGRNTWQLEEACCHFGIFPKKFAVYPDLLEGAGYAVGYTGKGWGPGDWKTPGWQRNPAGPVFSDVKLKPPYKGMSNVDYAGNFAAFLKTRKAGQPFCFWYGATEPHRKYEIDSGERAGKKLADVTLPKYLPDNPTVRGDFLDYALEVEWFDEHLGRILKQLEEAGELDNTIVVVTSDHGCPFPRVKGQIYEDGFHLPLAVRYGKLVKPGRVVADFINVRDFAPTFLELAGVPKPEAMTGHSIVPILASEKSGWVESDRNRMLIGKERHDVGRPNDGGYPVRALRTPEYLFVKNYQPERWPVGNPETLYPNCDDGPTKQFILSRFDNFYTLCFGKRPAEELYRIDQDPECLRNLAGDPQLAEVKKQLHDEMETRLKAEGDPRMFGQGDVFETYKYVGDRRHSYEAWEQHHKAEVKRE